MNWVFRKKEITGWYGTDMPAKLTTQVVYKILAVSGLLIVALTPYLGWKYFVALESRATSVFEQSIFSRLDLESTQQQYQSLENAIAASRQNPDHPDAVDYSASELKILQDELNTINARLNRLTDDLNTLEAVKQSLIKDAKLALGYMFALMSVAMLLASLGILGWYFHVRIYRERRNAPRQEETA